MSLVEVPLAVCKFLGAEANIELGLQSEHSPEGL